METLLEFYNAMPILVLLHGSECWTWTKKQINRTGTAEVCFLRAVADATLTDKRRNEDIIK
jgi:poly(3-hydroxybutyrate) depolymerase